MDEIDKNSTRKNVKIKVWELWGKGVELCQAKVEWKRRGGVRIKIDFKQFDDYKREVIANANTA